MKKTTYHVLLGAVALTCLACGCAVHPGPLANPNSQPLPEPIRVWGDNELFEESKTPLAIRVVNAPTSEEFSLSQRLQGSLNTFSSRADESNAPCDLQIMVDSDFREIAPAPQVRMYHLLTINTASADGTQLIDNWQHKSECAEAFTSAEECKTKLLNSAANSMNDWVRKSFFTQTGQLLEVSVVRFRLAKYLIDLNFYRIETEQRAVLNKLRSTPGVCNVRMIEFDADKRIASFRVLYRKDMLPKGIRGVEK